MEHAVLLPGIAYLVRLDYSRGGKGKKAGTEFFAITLRAIFLMVTGCRTFPGRD
jgi:hypothetical protein